MQIKRLKHHAQNLGQMFCGDELMFDYQRIAQMGSGILFLNILTGDCLHNGIPIQKLNIASTLKQWMDQDLRTHGIEISEIQTADLTVNFKTERYLGQKSKSSWSDPTPYFVGCTLDCASKVQAFGREYLSSYHDSEEWPESYSWCKGGHVHRA